MESTTAQTDMNALDEAMSTTGVNGDAKPSAEEGAMEEEAAAEEAPAPIEWGPAPEEAVEAKARGNEHFKKKEYDEAITCYDEALGASPDGHPDTAVYYANRAACLLAQGDNEQVV